MILKFVIRQYWLIKVDFRVIWLLIMRKIIYNYCMKNAVVLFKTDLDFREKLEKRLNGIKVIFNENNTDIIEKDILENTVIIFGNPSQDFLAKCPKLEWLQLQSAGADGYTSGEIGQNTILTSATGGYGHAVSEYMLSVTFALCKKLHLFRDEQLKSQWKPRGNVKSIQGSTVLVLGMGDIGNEYARKMKSLGAYIIGIRRTQHRKPEYADEMYLSEKLDEILPRADIIAMILPGVKATENIMSRERLFKMKKGAILINAGRGSAIDQDALCDAIETGHLESAALDVTKPEPLPQNHRFWKVENIIITPHIAGGRYMPETAGYIMELNLENARRFANGKKLKSIVNIATGYCYPEN